MAPIVSRVTRCSIGLAAALASLICTGPAHSAESIWPSAHAPNPPVCCPPPLSAQSEASQEAALTCPQEGICDDPSTRDRYIPDSTTPIKYIKLQFHNYCTDSGSNPALDWTGVLTAVDELNACYEPHRVQFVYDWRYLYHSAFHTISAEGDPDYTDWDSLFRAKLFAYQEPTQQLNIVSLFNYCVWQGQMTLCGGAYYPWNVGYQDSRGGIYMTPNHWNASTLICHEVGHAVGLWHTFEFALSYPACGPCYDSPGGGDDDLTGDRCSDTPPQPVNYTCTQHGGIDSCSGQPWGAADLSNHMGYGPYPLCHDHFTTQQSGRMHCWLEHAAPGWIAYAKIEPDVDFGPAPLVVQFDGVTSLSPNSWIWDFGDGHWGSGGSPLHTYESVGVHQPSVTLDAAEGVHEIDMSRAIWVYADTVRVAVDTAGPGQSARLDLRVNSSVPLDYVDVPLRWDGPADLTLDSITTTGLRTESCPAPQQLHLDPAGQRGCWRLRTIVDHRAMAPDTGAILSAWFTPGSDTGYVVNLVRVEPYSSYELDFVTVRGTYSPETATGAVVVCRPGFNCCTYLPGDVQGDSLYTSADIVYLVNYTFKGGPSPLPCEAAGDANCDWTITASDVIYMVNHIFKGGPAPCDALAFAR